MFFQHAVGPVAPVYGKSLPGVVNKYHFCWQQLFRFISTHRKKVRSGFKGDHYSTLKISPKATASQIKTAYYKLSLIYHPDRNSNSSESQEKFSDISDAYQVLSDKDKKQAYDRTLATHVFDHDVLARHRKSNLKYKDAYDEWTRAHYGNAFQKSQQRAQERIEFLRQVNQMKERKLQNRKLLVTITFLISFSLFVLSLKN